MTITPAKPDSTRTPAEALKYNVTAYEDGAIRVRASFTSLEDAERFAENCSEQMPQAHFCIVDWH